MFQPGSSISIRSKYRSGCRHFFLQAAISIRNSDIFVLAAEGQHEQLKEYWRGGPISKSIAGIFVLDGDWNCR